jgi:peroxiredoxin
MIAVHDRHIPLCGGAFKAAFRLGRGPGCAYVGPQIRGEGVMTIKTGDRLPDAEFRVMTADGPKPVRTAEVFGGKRVALFAVPGAFTPTCSARHLPGFKERAGDLKAKGVDEIVCVSVNDAWVMGAWGEAQGVGPDIVMLADGSGDFTRALGLEMDASRFGLGQRSQRYSMVVDDGVVEQLNVEQAGQFEVSSADYMVEHL